MHNKLIKDQYRRCRQSVNILIRYITGCSIIDLNYAHMHFDNVHDIIYYLKWKDEKHPNVDIIADIKSGTYAYGKLKKLEIVDEVEDV